MQKYSELTTGTLVIINTNLWGWINRNRIFWLAGDGAKLNKDNMENIHLPAGFALQTAAPEKSNSILRVANSSDKP